MSEVSFSNFQTHFEKSGITPSIIETVKTSKTLQTHFGESSLAPCSTEVKALPSKPQIPSSYQTLLVRFVINLDKLQEKLVQFDTQQIEKIADKIQLLFSKRLDINNLVRQREMNANKWKVVTTVIGAGMLVSSFCITPSFAVLGIFSNIVKNLSITCTTQQLLNQAYLQKTLAEKTLVDHEFKKETMQQSRLTQNSGTNAFSELEEQIHLLAIALDKQAINF